MLTVVILYSIRNWNLHFENNRTRDLKKLDWVPTPNKHDGDGFTDLICRDNGVAYFGAWNLLLQVASKCQPRGVLIRQIPAGGCGGVILPHDSASLARMTRCPKDIFDEALKVLVSIGWIECKDLEQSDLQNVASRCEIGADTPHTHSAGACLEEKRMNGREGNVQKAGDGLLLGLPESVKPALVIAYINSESEQNLKRRICGWFKRRESTPWDKKEIERLKLITKLNTPEEDLLLLDKWFASSETYHRRDVLTLLNNWNTEIDRARNYVQPKINNTNPTKRTDGNVGTLNEGKSSQYRGVGKVS